MIYDACQGSCLHQRCHFRATDILWSLYLFTRPLIRHLESDAAIFFCFLSVAINKGRKCLMSLGLHFFCEGSFTMNLSWSRTEEPKSLLLVHFTFPSWGGLPRGETSKEDNVFMWNRLQFPHLASAPPSPPPPPKKTLPLSAVAVQKARMSRDHAYAHNLESSREGITSFWLLSSKSANGTSS